MGIFSKKKRISVGVSTSPMFSQKPDVLNTAVMAGIYQGTSIAENIISQSVNGIYGKMEQYYNFGKKYYFRGLPEGYESYGSIDFSELAIVIGDIYGQPVTVLDVAVTNPIDEYLAWEYLQDNCEFNYETLVVGKPSFPYAGTVKYKSAEFVGDNLEITYDLIPTTGSSTTATYSYQNSKFLPNNIMAHVTFVLNSNPDRKLFWVYDSNSGVHSTITTLINDSYGSPFYPVVNIRHDKVNVVSKPKDGKEYKDTVKILGKLGIDLEALTETIMSNPETDPNLVDEVFLMLACDIQKDNPNIIKYLYLFFEDLANKSKISKSDFVAWESSKTTEPPFNLLDISEDDYKTSIAYNWITVTDITGNIAGVNKFTRETVVRDKFELPLLKIEYERSSLILRKQINETTYREIEINGLEHTSSVYENKVVVRNLEASLRQGSFEDDDGFYIPINRGILRKLPLHVQCDVMYDSLVLVVYAVQITYTKWYKSAFFLKLVQIVLFVVAVVLANPLVFSAAITWTAVINIIIQLIINVAAVQLLTYAVSILSPEFGAIFAAVLAVVAMYYGFGKFDLQSAQNMLQMSSGALAGTQKRLGEDFEDLLSEFENEWDALKALENEIDEANNLLLSDSERMGINNQIMSNIFAWEEPSSYIDRMVHTPNPGVASIGLVSGFVAMALQLPKIDAFTPV